MNNVLDMMGNDFAKEQAALQEGLADKGTVEHYGESPAEVETPVAVDNFNKHLQARAEEVKREHRVRRIPIDPAAIFLIFQSGNKFFKVDGFPVDSVYLGTGFDVFSGTWQMYVGHESFEQVVEGADLPLLDVEFTVVEPKK